MISIFYLLALVAARDYKLSEFFDIQASQDFIFLSNSTAPSSVQLLTINTTTFKQKLSMNFSAFNGQPGGPFSYYYIFGFFSAYINQFSLPISFSTSDYYTLSCGQPVNGKYKMEYFKGYVTRPDHNLRNSWCLLEFPDNNYNRNHQTPTLEIKLTVEIPLQAIYMPTCAQQTDCQDFLENVYPNATVTTIYPQIQPNYTYSIQNVRFAQNVYQNVSKVLIVGPLENVNLTNITISCQEVQRSDQTNVFINIKQSNYLYQEGLVKCSSNSYLQELSQNFSLNQDLRNSSVIIQIQSEKEANNPQEYSTQVVNVSFSIYPIDTKKNQTYSLTSRQIGIPPSIIDKVVAYNVPLDTQVIYFNSSSGFYRDQQLNFQIYPLRLNQDLTTNSQGTSVLLLFGLYPAVITINYIDNDQYNYRQLVKTITMFDLYEISQTRLQKFQQGQPLDLSDKLIALLITSTNYRQFWGFANVSIGFKFQYPKQQINYVFYPLLRGPNFSGLAAYQQSVDVKFNWLFLNVNQNQTVFKIPSSLSEYRVKAVLMFGFQDLTLVNISRQDRTGINSKNAYSYACWFNKAFTYFDISNNWFCYGQKDMKNSFYTIIYKYLEVETIFVINTIPKKNTVKTVQNCESKNVLLQQCYDECQQLQMNIDQVYTFLNGSNSNACFNISKLNRSQIYFHPYKTEVQTNLYYSCLTQDSKSASTNFIQTTINQDLILENFTNCKFVFWADQNLLVRFSDFFTQKSSETIKDLPQCLDIDSCFVIGKQDKIIQISTKSTGFQIESGITRYFQFNDQLVSQIYMQQVVKFLCVQQTISPQDILIQGSDGQNLQKYLEIEYQSSSGYFTISVADLSITTFGITLQPLSLVKSINVTIQIS